MSEVDKAKRLLSGKKYYCIRSFYTTVYEQVVEAENEYEAAELLDYDEAEEVDWDSVLDEVYECTEDGERIEE